MSSLNQLAGLHVSLEEYQKSEPLLIQSLALAKELKDLEGENSALTYLAMIYTVQYKPDKLTEIYLRQQQIAREGNDLFGEARALGSFGHIYNNQNRFEDAIDALQQALKIDQSLDINKLDPEARIYTLSSQLLTLSGLSSAYLQLGNSEKALEFAQRAVTQAQKLAKPELEVDTLLQLASLYSNGISNDAKAIESAQSALTIARKINNPPRESKALQQLSSSYIRLGNYADALKLAQQSLQIAQQYKDVALENETLEVFRNIYRAQGNSAKALEIDQQRWAKVQKSKNWLYAGLTLNSLSESYLAVGDTTKAIKTANQVFNFSPEKNYPAVAVIAWLNLSNAYQARGEAQQGIAVAQKSLELSRKTRSLIGQLAAVAPIARINQSLGDYQNVVASLEPYLSKARQLKNPVYESQLLASLGSAQASLGNYQNGKAMVEQALKIARDLKNPALESDALNSLGEITKDLSDYPKALSLHQQSLTIAQSLTSPPKMIAPQINLGNVYNELGDYAKSRTYYEQAIATAKQLKNRRSEGVVLLNLSNIAFKQGKPQNSITYAQKALAIFQSLRDLPLQTLANRAIALGYGELGNDAKSIESAQSTLAFAQKVKNPVFEKSALSLLASLHSKFGRNEQAIDAYQRAIALQTDNPNDNAYLYAGLARIYADRNQPQLAIVFYKQAVNSIQTVRRNIEGLPPQLQASFLQNTIDLGSTKTSDIYRKFADVLLSQGQVLEAQQVLELLKIQEIRDFDRTTRAKISSTGELISLDPTEEAIIKKYGSYLSLIEKARSCQTSSPQCSEITALRNQAQKEFDNTIETLKAELAKRQEIDKQSFLNPRGNLSGKAATLLDRQPDRAILYSLVTDDRIWLILATADAPLRTFEIKVSRKELSTTVEEFRGLMEQCQKPGYVCSQTDTQAIKQVSRKLYSWLFPQELQKELPLDKIKHLMFSLDRNIRYIPMSALFDGKSYLVEKYAISTITTADRPENQPFPSTAQKTSVLAMGASKFPDGLRELHNVETELNAIVKSTSQDRVGVYPGLKYFNSDFNKTNLQNSLLGRNVLHLASRGVFNLNIPSESYIALGNSDQLKISQIKDLLLSGVDLVVLSACQTALGGRERGNEEGVEIASLGAAFLENNRAKSVLASLWNVDDISTSLLMQQLYQNLAKNTPQAPVTRAQALQQAQLQFIQGKTTIADGNRLRASIRIKEISRPANSNSNHTPDFTHPYYWSPFVLMGSGF